MTPDEACAFGTPASGPRPHGPMGDGPTEPHPQPQLLRAHWAEPWAACAPRAAAGWVLEYSGGGPC